MEFKGHHCEPSCPLGFSHPLMNPYVQTNCHTLLKTRSPKWIVVPLCKLGHPKKPMRLSTIMPLGTKAPNLGVTLMLMCPNLLVSLYLGNPLGVFACPRWPLAQLGCWSNHKFHILEDLGEVICSHRFEDLTSSPHVKSSMSLETSKKYVISKSPPELMPPLQLSLLETPSFVPTRNPKLFQSGNPKFPCKVKTQSFPQNNQIVLHPTPHNIFSESI